LPEPTAKAARVMVVDDNPAYLESLADLLEGEGYAVTTLPGAVEALDHLDEHDPPALIILDLAMPQVNGREFVSKLKESPGRREIPILVVSGLYSAAQLPRLAADAYLEKPADPAVLLETVARLARPTAA
jgi:two-component system chemotaxis response regulator CheY